MMASCLMTAASLGTRDVSSAQFLRLSGTEPMQIAFSSENIIIATSGSARNEGNAQISSHVPKWSCSLAYDSQDFPSRGIVAIIAY